MIQLTLLKELILTKSVIFVTIGVFQIKGLGFNWISTKGGVMIY